MGKYLIFLNKIPLFNIYNDHSSSLIILEYDYALAYVEKLKESNPSGNYEIISENTYYEQLQKVNMNEKFIEYPKINIEDLLSPEQKENYNFRMEYYDNNINGFSLPIVVEKDSDYVKELSIVLKKYHDFLCNKVAFKDEPNLLKEIEFNIDRINCAIENYYRGDIVKSKLLINEILEQYKSDDENFFVSELDKSYAFRGIAPFVDLQTDYYEQEYKEMNEEPLSFYKARTGNVEDRDGMLHIPFDMRGLIATQRFSIAGIPCIYLGTTSYVCWQELDKPANQNFNVCSYKVNEKGKRLKILNLVISQPLINGIFNRGRESEQSIEKKIQIKMLKLFPLVIATSFTVLEKERKFKSEYIISQLIMHCLKELQIDGVAYLSKKGKNDFQYPHGVNLAIPVFEGSEHEKYGEVCDSFALSEPINYETFLNLKISDFKEQSYINKIFREKNEYGYDNFNAKVDFNGDSTFYGNIKFSDFDNYLVNIESFNAISSRDSVLKTTP